MKLLLALNYKFMEMDLFRLMKLIEEHDIEHVVDGYEIMVDCKKKEHMAYLENLVHLAKEKGFILQVHSSSYDDLEVQKRFLDEVEHLALFLDRKIHIVYHPFGGTTEESALEKTNHLLAELLIYCYQKKYHLILSLENLEHRVGSVRLDKEEIVPVLYNNIDLHYTYDLGHELRDYGNITDVDHLLLERLNNVHLFRNEREITHLPLTDGDIDKEKWVKSLLYLKQSGYQGSVVLEYDFYQMEGETFEEKIISYLKHASFIKEYL